MSKTKCVICHKEIEPTEIIACSFAQVSPQINNLSTWNACNECHHQIIKPKIKELLKSMNFLYGDEEVMPNADHK